ncbi:MAG TPA: hypothetical protein VK634_12090, partial [Reyranella sp.]|nr:hypothetical protein [Reyranella sp.]
RMLLHQFKATAKSLVYGTAQPSTERRPFFSSMRMANVLSEQLNLTSAGTLEGRLVNGQYVTDNMVYTKQ